MSDVRDPLDVSAPPLAALYVQASGEMPGAAADAVILALAAQAAAQTAASSEVRTASGWSRRWRAPLALAASLVLTVGIVSRIGLDPPDAATVHGESIGAPGTGMPPKAAPAVSADAATPPAVANGAKQKALKTDSASGQAIPLAGAGSLSSGGGAEPSSRSGEPFPATQRKAPGAPPAPAEAPAVARAVGSAALVVPPASGPDADARPAANAQSAASAATRARPAGALAGAADAAGGGATAPPLPGDHRRDAVPAPAMKSSQRAPQVAAESSAQDAVSGAVSPVLSVAREAALTPEEWISYVIGLRRLGQHEAAQASLKRFRERYPLTPIPAQAFAAPAPPSGEVK